MVCTANLYSQFCCIRGDRSAGRLFHLAGETPQRLEDPSRTLVKRKWPHGSLRKNWDIHVIILY